MPRQPPFDGSFDDTQEPLPRPNAIQDFDPLYDYHRLTRDLPQGPDYLSDDEPEVSVKLPAKRSAPPEFRSLQTPARDEISRAVQDAVLSKHQRNATDNVGPDAKPQASDDELKSAQSSDKADRNAYQLAHSLDVAASLMSGRHGKVDDSYYNNLINNANVNEKQVLSRRNERRAGEDQTLQMKLGDQSVEKNDRSLARDATEEDKTSSLSEGARGIIARIIPKIAADPSFRNMSAKDIREQFPMISKEIDELKAAEHESHEDARNRDDNRTKKEVALIGQQDGGYKKEMAEYLKGKLALKEAELSSRSYQNAVPVPGVIPSEKQATTFATAATAHDKIDNLIQHIEESYSKHGPNYLTPDGGRDGLAADIEQLRIIINEAEGQGAMSKGHYESMKKIVSDPDAPKRMLSPEYFMTNMNVLRTRNHESYRETARANNYVTKGESDFGDASDRNAVPKVAPAPKTPIPNPAATVTGGGSVGASGGGTVSTRGPVAPGGVVKVRLKKDHENAKAGTTGSVDVMEFNENPDLYERIR